MDFTAIDFETANGRADSACQLAVVVVRDGQIVHQQQWLIRPRPFFFSPRNIQIHGIGPQQVADQPDFGALWADLRPHLTAGCLAAHNARFDIGVLRACLDRHALPIPELQFTCTCLIARRAWPGMGRYGLKPTASRLGIDFRHHDALEDSVACAKILLAAARFRAAQTLEQLEQQLRIDRGCSDAHGVTNPCRSGRPRRSVRAPAAGVSGTAVLRSAVPSAGRDDPHADHAQGPAETIDLHRLMLRAELLRSLAGKRIVFTGLLRLVPRQQAEQLAIRLGATCDARVTARTDLLVVGLPDQRTAAAGRGVSAKQQRAETLRSDGHPIQVITEQQFLGILTSEHVQTQDEPCGAGF